MGIASYANSTTGHADKLRQGRRRPTGRDPESLLTLPPDGITVVAIIGRTIN